LKDKKLRGPAKGDNPQILIECFFVYNKVQICFSWKKIVFLLNRLFLRKAMITVSSLLVNNYSVWFLYRKRTNNDIY
jgi:hypothetical protein